MRPKYEVRITAPKDDDAFLMRAIAAIRPLFGADEMLHFRHDKSRYDADLRLTWISPTHEGRDNDDAGH